jgi:hypothetical protein
MITIEIVQNCNISGTYQELGNLVSNNEKNEKRNV